MDSIRIGDACEVLNGFAFKSEAYVDDGIRIIRIANVQKGFIEDSSPVFYPFDTLGIGKFMLEEGDLLLSLTGNVGRVAILEKQFLPAALNQRVACLRLKTNLVSKGYLFHILNSNFFEQQCIQSSKGVAQKNMSTEWLKDFEIPLYKFDEQAKIATILDKVSDVISMRKLELNKLDELIKARFVEMFGDPECNPKGWKKESLNNHADVLVGYPFPSEGYAEKGTPIVGGYNLMHGFIQWDSSKYWPDIQGYEQYLLCDNDIVMAMDRPWVNGGFKIAQVEAKNLSALLIQRTARIRAKDMEQSFVYTLLDTPQFAKHCNITGSLVPHISNKDINSFEIIIPPNDMQKAFSAFVAQIDKSKDAVKKALDEAQLLFDSLMQRYFG